MKKLKEYKIKGRLVEYIYNGEYHCGIIIDRVRVLKDGDNKGKAVDMYVINNVITQKVNMVYPSDIEFLYCED
jgi:hypothetical protein